MNPVEARALAFLQRELHEHACTVRIADARQYEIPRQPSGVAVYNPWKAPTVCCLIDQKHELLVLREVTEIRSAGGRRFFKGFEVVDGGKA